MALLLQALGALFLLILLAVGGVGVWLYLRIRAVRRDVEGLLDLMNLPAAISLVRVLHPALSDLSREFEDELRDLGFEPVGTFAVSETEAFCLHAFFHPERQVFGVIHELSRGRGGWAELFYLRDAAGSFTASGAPQNIDLLQRPGHRKIYQPGAYPEQLWRIVRDEMRKLKARPTTAEEFETVFAAQWAAETKWRAGELRGEPDDIYDTEVTTGGFESIGDTDDSSQL